MNEEKSRIRISELKIKNYKKLDSLEISFFPPKMDGDPDILVFGSKNGGGKTSVLECCSLLMLAGILGKRFYRLRDGEDIASLIVKAGQKEVSLEGKFERGDKRCTISLRISASIILLKIDFDGDRSVFNNAINGKQNYSFNYFILRVLAFSSEPLIMPPLLHFNSYRKVQESKPELGMIAASINNPRTSARSGIPSISNPISSFKLEILRALMGQASLFEGLKQEQIVHLQMLFEF